MCNLSEEIRQEIEEIQQRITVLQQKFAELERLNSKRDSSQRTEVSPDVKSLCVESPTRAAGTRQTLKIGAKEYGFRWIPAGEFDMGSPESEEGRSERETLHHVKLTKGFWSLETEVTQSLYQEVMGANPSKFKGDDLPVENVSWDDATKFCAALTKRLPKELKASLLTEAQWEYACRAGTKTAYWYGNVANFRKMNDGLIRTTTPVKSYDPNPWGLYDMHGNVGEWCLDYFEDYPTGTVTDPKGSKIGKFHVVRGVWYDCDGRPCRSALRDFDEPDERFCWLGFRFLLCFD